MSRLDSTGPLQRVISSAVLGGSQPLWGTSDVSRTTRVPHAVRADLIRRRCVVFFAALAALVLHDAAVKTNGHSCQVLLVAAAAWCFAVSFGWVVLAGIEEVGISFNCFCVVGKDDVLLWYVGADLGFSLGRVVRC